MSAVDALDAVSTGWSTAVDSTTGKSYYYNAAGEVRWDLAPGGAPGGTAAGFSSPVRAAADQLPARPPASGLRHTLQHASTC